MALGGLRSAQESGAMIQLKALLPPACDDTISIEDQARSVLHLLCEPTNPKAPKPKNDPNLCPNCDQPVSKPTSPYCSETCRNQAAFVRQLRAAIATQTILNPEKQTVFGERLWWLLGGGLPIRESRITESGKRQVIKRCGGKCEFCNAPMTTIENFGSGCNRPLHLRAVCAKCSRTKPFNDPNFSQSNPVLTLLNDLRQRVNAPTPLRPCDDPDKWDWRAFIVQRRS
ncbi:MAG: hypothetical protein ACKVQS_02960 [Fimbriimonadaceae bacterium]